MAQAGAKRGAGIEWAAKAAADVAREKQERLTGWISISREGRARLCETDEFVDERDEGVEVLLSREEEVITPLGGDCIEQKYLSVCLWCR